MDWLKENGFGGIMVWSIDMDDFLGKCGNVKYPLLRTLNEELKGYKVALEYDGPYEKHGSRGAYTTKDRKSIFNWKDDKALKSSILGYGKILGFGTNLGIFEMNALEISFRKFVTNIFVGVFSYT